MATTLETRRADELAVAMDLLYLGLGTATLKKAKELGPITEVGLNGLFSTAVATGLKKLWAPEERFLRTSLEIPRKEYLKVEPLQWSVVNYEKTRIVEKVLQSQSLEHVREIGTAVIRGVAKQVDATQQYVGARKGFRWTRHLNAGACEWCQAEVEVYETLGVWHRHANCRCFKVKR